MSTASGISVKISDNEVMHVYNHCDGDLWGAGETLYKSFNSLERAKALVEQGNISLLRPNVNPDLSKPHGWFDLEYGAIQDKVCRFYSRDRGDKDNEVQILESVDEAPNYEYNYYFDGKEWLFRAEKSKRWISLIQALNKEGVYLYK